MFQQKQFDPAGKDWTTFAAGSFCAFFGGGTGAYGHQRLIVPITKSATMASGSSVKR